MSLQERKETSQQISLLFSSLCHMKTQWEGDHLQARRSFGLPHPEPQGNTFLLFKPSVNSVTCCDCLSGPPRGMWAFRSHQKRPGESVHTDYLPISGHVSSHTQFNFFLKFKDGRLRLCWWGSRIHVHVRHC